MILKWELDLFYLQKAKVSRKKTCRFCILLISWVILFRDLHKVASFAIRFHTRRVACTMRKCAFPKPRVVPFSAASLHVPHKEKRLHPAKAFTRMRQVSQVRRKKKRREKGGRILPRTLRGKVFLAHLPILRTNLPQRCFPYFCVPSSFLSSRLHKI